MPLGVRHWARFAYWPGTARATTRNRTRSPSSTRRAPPSRLIRYFARAGSRRVSKAPLKQRHTAVRPRAPRKPGRGLRGRATPPQIRHRRGLRLLAYPEMRVDPGARRRRVLGRALPRERYWTERGTIGPKSSRGSVWLARDSPALPPRIAPGTVASGRSQGA